MKVVILAAGKGTRMKERAREISKVMVPIKGRPKLEYTLDHLPDEITEIIMVVGHNRASIQDHFSEQYGERKITYVIQETLNGTDGAVRAAEELLKLEDRFLVLNGDDLYHKSDLRKLLKYRYATLAFYSHDAKQFGLIYIDDNDNLEKITEKSDRHSEGLVATGAYIVGSEYFTFNPVAISDTEFGLPHTLLSMREQYPLRVVHADFWHPVGTPEQHDAAGAALSEL